MTGLAVPFQDRLNYVLRFLDLQVNKVILAERELIQMDCYGSDSKTLTQSEQMFPRVNPGDTFQVTVTILKRIKKENSKILEYCEIHVVPHEVSHSIKGR